MLVASLLLMTSSMLPVSLPELLSTCVDAASRGCKEIGRVHSNRIASGGELSVALKDETDARSALTEADLAAQTAIVGALRAEWPGLRIVGEEDDDDSADSTAASSLRRDLCSQLACDSITAPLSTITIFVDPLDGTREFVEGRLQNVQSLVGIAVRGRAVGGAIGIPFPDGSLLHADASPPVVYSLVGAGAGMHSGDGQAGEWPKHTHPPSAIEQPPMLVTTGDSQNSILRAATAAALSEGGTHDVTGGVGAKLLAVAEGRASLAIMHFGTSLWDTAAPGALVASLGGKVTDLFGAPLPHLADAPSYKNELGVIASAPSAAAQRAHANLCAAMRKEAAALELLADAQRPATPLTTAQAADVARCLRGAPLRAETLSDQIKQGLPSAASGARLAAYTAPESSAFRGMMSDGVRLELTWEEAGQGSGGAQPQLPSSLFYKRVSMGDLEHARKKALASPLKLARDVKSYAVEAAFLKSAGCEQLSAALGKSGVQVARAFYAEAKPCEEEPIESRFAMLVCDFSPADGWYQSGALNRNEARAALAALARLHAFFWRGAEVWRDVEVETELEQALWPSGCCE